MPIPVRGTVWLLCALRGTRAIPVRSLWAIGVRSTLLILRGHSTRLVGLSSGAIVGQLVRCSAIASAIPSMH
ncbi:hypothetical protein kpv71_01 [Klebsiella phage KpV71]|uniref:Uncharacterized protein n=1 Tax=Klebsiella phage KpV71 TaxID=1796998 RepID=A0A142F0X3_BPK71|nr:hypothetical protein BJD76_gp01 [Klebsiella phage KpV71]AMQ66430.1 hypothetical protein kpv71_01 [Klebsiella phage KpV71]